MATIQRETQIFLGRVESARGIAALIVTVGHVLLAFLPPSAGLALYAQPSTTAMAGKFVYSVIDAGTAVTFFFVLSGMVLGMSLDHREVRLTAPSYSRFLWRRFFRIYPAHIGALLTIATITTLFVAQYPLNLSGYAQLGDSESFINAPNFRALGWGHIAANALLLNTDLNTVTWSLQVEIAAAFLIPLLHLAARQKRALVDTAVVAAFGLLSILLHARFNYASHVMVWLFAFYPGLLIASYGRSVSAVLTRFAGGADRSLFLAYLAMMGPGTLATGRPLWLAVTETGGAFALLSLLVHGQPGRIARALEHQALRWNGKVSYSFYLWHSLFLLFALRAIVSWLRPETVRSFELGLLFVVIAVVLPTSWLAAWASFKWIEVPWCRFGEGTTSLLALLTKYSLLPRITR